MPSLPVIVCPRCGAANRVVQGYKIGTLFGCTCGAYLEYAGDGQPGNPIEGEHLRAKTIRAGSGEAPGAAVLKAWSAATPKAKAESQ